MFIALNLQILELKKYSNRTYGCRDIKCQSPGNQQLWKQLSFLFPLFFQNPVAIWQLIMYALNRKV